MGTVNKSRFTAFVFKKDYEQSLESEKLINKVQKMHDTIIEEKWQLEDMAEKKNQIERQITQKAAEARERDFGKPKPTFKFTRKNIKDKSNARNSKKHDRSPVFRRSTNLK